MNEHVLLTETRTVSVYIFLKFILKHFVFLFACTMFVSRYNIYLFNRIWFALADSIHIHTHKQTCIHIGKVDMKAGTYNYHFECMLPSDLPSSIEGRIGSVRYFVRVIIDNTVLTNEIFKRTLNIIRPLDLNADLLYRVIHAVHLN